MCLETRIAELTSAVERLIVAMQGDSNAPSKEIVAKQQVVAPKAPPVVHPNPVGNAGGNAPVVPTTSVMPPPPVLTAVPTPQVAPTGAPFSDPKGLLGYVMEAYKTMGPAKGARIQEILAGMGVQNINDVQPTQYAALYAGVEALKAAA